MAQGGVGRTDRNSAGISGGRKQGQVERSSWDADDEGAWDAAAAGICAGAENLPDLLRKPDASGAKDERLKGMLTWRHACFLDVITADSQLAAVVTPRSPPAAMTPTSGSISGAGPRRAGLRLTVALHFVQDLLAAAPPLSLPPELIESAVVALTYSAQLAASVPVGLSASEGSRKLLEYISQLTDRLRRVEEAGSGLLLVPIGWLNSATGAPAAGRSPAAPASSATPAELLLALHCSSAGWDVAVCSASSGLGYHPSYPIDEVGEGAQHDPVLIFRHVRADRLLDSAPWFLLYRQLAFRTAAHGVGARALYEVVLPFLSGRSIPAAVRRDPPPAELRRRAAPLGDRTRAATALEGLQGLLLLSGATAADATLVTLRLRRMALVSSGWQLRALHEMDGLCIGQHDHSLIAAGCRGLAAHAAAAAALPWTGVSRHHTGGTFGCNSSARASAGVASAHALAGGRAVGAGSEGGTDGGGGAGEGDVFQDSPTRRLVSAAPEAELLAVARLVGLVSHTADALHTRALGTGPPALCLPVGLAAPADAMHGLFSRFRRLEDVSQHAGVAPNHPFLRPVRLTCVAESVASVAEVSAALQQALTQCTLLASQANGIKNSGCIRVALLEHLFTAVIPIPLPLDLLERPTRCFWHTARVGFLEQAGLVRLVGALAQHYAAASLCLTLNREHDGARIVTLACMAALLDALLRLQAADLPSLLSRHYAGAVGEPSAPFGFDAGGFAEESQSLKLVAPELAVARAMLLDYFQSVRRAAGVSRRLFGWEQPGGFGEGELALVGQLASEMGLGDDGRADERARMLTGESAELVTLFPELATCRDVAFLLKLLMTPTADGLPQRKRWRSSDARLVWAHAAKGGGLTVRGFGREIDPGFVEARADRPAGISSWLPFGGRGGGPRARVPASQAVPSALLAHLGLKDDKLATEDAILFLSSEELHGFQAPDDERDDRRGWHASGGGTTDRPTAAHRLSARDAELLLQYLTAPYLRIPLLLGFFADPLRVQALAQPRMQELLEACLFEPGPWQHQQTRPMPETIPIPRDLRAEMLCTPLGLLFNELALAPPTLLLPHVRRMLAAALDMDTGTSESASAAVIFFVVRLAVRVEAYVAFFLQHGEWRKESESDGARRTMGGDAAEGVEEAGGVSVAGAGSEASGVRAAFAEADAVAVPAGPGTAGVGVSCGEGGVGGVACRRVLSSHRSAAAILHVPRGDRASDRRMDCTGAAAGASDSCASVEGPAVTSERQDGATDESSWARVESRLCGLARADAPGDMPGNASRDVPGDECSDASGYSSPDVAVGRGAGAPVPEALQVCFQGVTLLPHPLPATEGGAPIPIAATLGYGGDEMPEARAPALVKRRAATCACISVRPDDSGVSAPPACSYETRPAAGASPADELGRACPVASSPPPPPVSLCGPKVIARGLDTALDASRVAALRDEVRLLRAHLDGEVCALLSAWFDKSLSTKDVRGACVVIAHLALLFQNTPEHALDTRACSWLLAAQVFLTHNFEWDTELPVDAPSAGAPRAAHTQQTRRAAARDLRIPQTQLFDLWQRHRHALLRRLSDPSWSAERGVVMAHVVRAVACTSPLAATGAEETEPWREMAGERNAGRFVLDYNAEGRDRQQAVGADSGAAASGGGGGMPTPLGAFEEWLRRECSIAPTQQEINLQLGEYHASVARKQLEVLHASFVDFADFRSIFGQAAKPSSFQSAEVEATEQRTWLRLVHRRHELHRWAAPPADFSPPVRPHTHPYLSWIESVERRVESVVPFMRGSSSTSRKAWLRELLEPVRVCHFKSLHLLLPPLDEAFASAPAALLGATAADGTHKEVVVLRQPACVMVYNLVEHGRRWYRVLAFSSRADCSLASLPVRLWRPEHVSLLACGDAMEPTAATESLIITRHVGTSLVGLPPFLPAAAATARGAPAPDRPTDRLGGWGDFLTRHLHLAGGVSSPAPAARPAAPPALSGQSTHATIEQTFVPSRLLCGLLSEALLQSHLFWQNEDDSLSGYPRGGRAAQEPGVQPTVLLVSLEPVALPPDVAASDAASAVGASGDAVGGGPAPDRHASASVRRRRLCPRPDAAAAPAEARRGREGVELDATLADDAGWVESPDSRGGQDDELLLNLLHPEAPPAVAALAELFRRVEDVSHVLAWARLRDGAHADERGRGQAETTEWALASVELPRLRLTFDVRPGSLGSEPKLHCREHAGYFISNAAGQPGRLAQPDEPAEDAARAHSLRELLRCLPHALVLEDGQGDLAVLVSAAAKPFWPPEQPAASGARAADCRDAGTCLLHRSDEWWLQALTQARHYLYPVHPSLRVLCSRTLASSLYLLLMHLAHRQYDAVLKLADACMADTRLSAEEEQLWAAIEEAGNIDHHPEAHAARLKIWLVVWRWRFENPLDHPPGAEMDVSSTHVSIRASLIGAAATPPSRHNALTFTPTPSTTPGSQRGRRAPPTADPAAAHLRLGSWDLSASLESYVLHRPMIRANCRLQPEEELALLSRQLGTLTAAASREPLTPQAAHVAAELAAYHDALLDAARPTTSEPPLARARPRFQQAFETAPSGPSPLASAVWFDETVRARALLSPPDDGSPQPAPPPLPSVLKAPSAQPAQDFTGEGALRHAHSLLDSLSLESHFVPLYELITGRQQLTLQAERDSSCLMGALLLRCLPPEDWQASQPLVALLDLLTHLREEMREGVPLDQLDDGLAARLRHYDELKSDGPEEAQADLALAQVEIAPFPPRIGRVRIEPVVSAGGPDETPLAALWRQLQGDDTARRLVKHAALAVLDSRVCFPEDDALHPAPARRQQSPEPEATPSQHRVRGRLFPQRVTARWLARPLRPGDSSCSERELQAPMADSLSSPSGQSGSGPLLRVAAGELEALVTQPLLQLGLDSLVVHVMRCEASCLPDPARELSDVLDVENHPYARTHVAIELLDRLKVDVRGYAAAWEHVRTPQLRTLQPEEVSECVQRALLGRTGSSLSGSKLEKALQRLSEIESKLLRLRAHDAAQTEQDIRKALSAANCEVAPSSTRAELGFALRQLAGEEARADFADVAVQLLSSSAVADLGQFNPHLNARRGSELLQLMAVVLLRTSRRAFLASAITAARGLRMGLLELHKLGDSPTKAQADRTRLDLQNKAAQLAEMLCTCRSLAPAEPGTPHPASPLSAAARGLSMGLQSAARAESEASPTFLYDPRFLVFESISMLILREEQVHLVHDFVKQLSRGDPSEKRAVVSQLIMGAGKTTVILPLLALLLADGSQLIIQVVPATLLTFTRAVLRERFSSFVSKPIYTFAFDRATIPAPALVDKLRDAERSGGLVCSTPTAIKSFALAFVHLMHQLDYNLRRDLQRPEPRESGPPYMRALGAFFGRQNPTGDSGVASALHEQERLRAPHGVPQGRPAEVKVCCEVMSILDRGVLMLDEVDLILHPLRSELNWPLGKRMPLDFTSEKHALGMRWELPLHLLDPLHYAGYGKCVMQVTRSKRSEQLLKRIKCAVDRGCEERAMTRQPHLQLLEPRFYEEKLRPLLALWLLLYIIKMGVTSLDEEEMRAWIEHGQPPPKGKAAALERDAWQVKLLNLSHDLLVTTLPFVLSKVNRVTYGLLSPEQIEAAQREHGHVPQSRRLLAVPFVGKDTPSLASEFSHPDVLISLTSLAFSHEGLRDSDVRAVLGALHDEMHKQFGPYHARPALHTYIQWVEGAGARVRGMRQPAGATGRGMADGSSSGCDASLPSTPLSAPRLGTRPGAPYAVGGVGAGCGWPASAGPAMAAAAPPLREVWPLHLIEWDNTEQMSVLFSLLRRQPEVVRYYLVNEKPKEEPRGVFRRTMHFQNLKLCASGQEIGGDVLFGRRMGFSGTPNNLLPEELGKCSFTPGDDARMLHVLTSPSVVEASVLPVDWSVVGLLKQVAEYDPPLHALIDTGALITGLSNGDVARKLLEAGLKHADGVVFMDASGCKMILMREGMQVLKLEQCGLPPSRRFSFYDQVHTTGIDIEQPAAAAAALTLGKDMTFRDYAQGAFRMRGIGRGQRIEVLITLEIHQLINDAVAKSAPQRAPAPPPADDDLCKRVVQWLHVNTMRSESLQFHLLCDQSLSNVWRKAAFLRLREAHAGGRAGAGAWSKDLENAIDIFRTKVDLGVSDEVPGGHAARHGGPGTAARVAAELAAPAASTPSSSVPAAPAAAPMETVGGLVRNDRGRVSLVMERDGGVDIASTFLTDPVQVDTCNSITARLGTAEDVESKERASRQSGAAARASGGVQPATPVEHAFEALGAKAEQEEELEQQQECQQEEEREQQQQTIVVRSELDEPPSVVLDSVGPHDFSRKVDAPQAWGVRVLLDPPAARMGDASPFYALSDLRLPGTDFTPLRFPPSLLLSRNYFQPVRFTATSTSHRRMKNVIMLLDWAPGSSDYGRAAASPHEPAEAFNQEAEARLAAAWELLAGGDTEGGISVDELEGLMVGEGLNPDAATLAAHEREGGQVTFEAARRALAQQRPAEANVGRYLLAVSLEEAEGVRALLHGLQALEQPLGAALALRHGEELFEASAGCAADESDQQALAARQCFRLFDCEVNFTPREVTATLRAVQENLPETRVRWFEAVRACRRRERRDWRAAPVARVFHTLDHAQLVQEEAVRHKVAAVLRKNRVHPATFFAQCDMDHDGVLSERDLQNEFNSLEGLRIEPAQFAVLARRLDADGVGSITRPEWCALFADATGGGHEALVREADLASLDDEAESDDGERADWLRGAGRGLSDTAAIDRPRAPAVEIPHERLLKLQVRLHALGRGVRLAWSTKGTTAQTKLSLWAPEVKAELWTSNKHRFCVGHYGNASFDQPPPEARVIELEDVTQWHVVKGPWLDAALAQNAPHPDYYRLVWRKESVEPPIYAWRPVPPSGGDFVGLGMVFTTSHVRPPRSAVRCVHRQWVRPSDVEPECLWKDSGMGGEAGSVWRVNSMQLVVATKGHTRPAGPFYELIDKSFTLLEVAADTTAGRASAPGSPRSPAPALLPPLPVPSCLPPPAVAHPASFSPGFSSPAASNHDSAAPPAGSHPSSNPTAAAAFAPTVGGISGRTPSTRGAAAAETPPTTGTVRRGVSTRRGSIGEQTPRAGEGGGSLGVGAGDGLSAVAQPTPGPASSAAWRAAAEAAPEHRREGAGAGGC